MDSDYHSILTGGLTYEQEYQLRHIPGTRVTTYEYRVPVGMIRKTDPSNRSIYYDYDEHGRLKTVSDSALAELLLSDHFMLKTGEH